MGPTAVRLLGYPLTEWYENDFWATHLAPDERDRVIEDRCRKVDEGCGFEISYRMVASNGERILFREVAMPARLEDGTIGLRGVFLGRGESACPSRAPGSVRELACSLGHDLSQPLGAVLVNAETIKRLLESRPPRIAEALEALDDVLGCARQAACVITRMRGATE